MLFSTFSTSFSTKKAWKGEITVSIFVEKVEKAKNKEIYLIYLHSLKCDVKNIPRSRTKGGI